MNKNQRGFSLVEALLILIIVGIVGFVGWFVLRNRATNRRVNKTALTQTTSSTQKTTSTKSPTNPKIDPYVDWQTITNPDGTWKSIKIPKV